MEYAVQQPHPLSATVLGQRHQRNVQIFFFYCIAELAIKPCRSSRSDTRGGFEKFHDTCKTGNKNTTKQKNTQTNKQNTNTKDQRQVSLDDMLNSTRKHKVSLVLFHYIKEMFQSNWLHELCSLKVEVITRPRIDKQELSINSSDGPQQVTGFFRVVHPIGKNKSRLERAVNCILGKFQPRLQRTSSGLQGPPQGLEECLVVRTSIEGTRTSGIL